MKRTVVVAVALIALVFGVLPGVSAAPSPEGALKSAFNAGLSGGNGVYYSSEAHGANSLGHAANNAIWEQDGASRIIPGWGDFFDQEYCSDDVFGVWWYLIGYADDKQVIRDSEVRIWIDGVELEVTTTPVKRLVAPQDFFFGDEEPFEWWRSFGVPVLGSLDPGTYFVESTIAWPGDPLWSDYANVTILDAATHPDCQP